MVPFTWCISQAPRAKPGTLTRTMAAYCGLAVRIATTATEPTRALRKSVVMVVTPHAVPYRER